MTSKPNPNSGSLNFSQTDQRMMRRALELAWQGRYGTSPNPRVGCVIAHGNNIVGEGYHQRQGQAHAEIFALQAAQEQAKGATAYVTLEPCAHYGKTPPCANALIQAQIKRVVIAQPDPNPQVAGKGLALLNQAGIETASGLYQPEARKQNPGFLSRFERQRPFVRLKCAQSLDGKTALKNGLSQWITSEAARSDVQEWRAQSCAILTGVGTILADNPRLNVREINTFRQPLRIILDSQLRTPANAHVIHDSASPTLIVTHSQDKEKIKQYQKHIEILHLPPNSDGQIDLNTLFKLLAQRGIGEIWTESGATLNGSLIKEKQIDELIIYQAPIILGDQARNAFTLPELTALSQATHWQITDQRTIGPDTRLILSPTQS